MTEANARVRVLAVSPSESDLRVVSQILGHSTWQIETATCLDRASRSLAGGNIQVVLCDCGLPDGDWKQMLAMAGECAEPPLVVVTSCDADDRLWAEVLNLGAYDVLAKPFKAREVFESVGLAWRQWMATRKRTDQSIPKRGVASASSGPPLTATGR